MMTPEHSTMLVVGAEVQTPFAILCISANYTIRAQAFVGVLGLRHMHVVYDVPDSLNRKNNSTNSPGAVRTRIGSNPETAGGSESEESMPKQSMLQTKRCPRCRLLADQGSAPGYCTAHHTLWQHERRAVVAWAHWALATRNVVLLDTETTGLDNEAEVLELALLSTQGEVLFDTLIRPQGPIPAAATAVHQIDASAVAHAPTFGAVYPRLVALLRKRFVIVYNAAYDRRILDQTCARYGLPPVRPAAWHCAMLEYAKFTGVWNAAKQDYTWHKLQGGDHSALGDCRATLATIAWMAEANG